MRRLLWVVGCLTTASLVACGAQPPSGPGPTSSGAAARGLRGYAVASLTCPDVSAATDPGAPAPIPGVASQLVVCPVLGPVDGAPRPPRVVTPSDGVVFSDLVAALSRPDIDDPSVSACPAMAMLPRVVLLRTDAGTYSAHLPIDTCHFYQPEVLAAIQAAER
jgi:hypothetical protein